MKKFLVKITSYLIVLAIGIWFGNQGIKLIWGKAESNLKKTETVLENKEMNNLHGLYISEKGADITSSEISFSIGGEIESTDGRFNQFNIEFDIQDDYLQSTIRVVIDASSIYTANTMRDESLKGEDFFHVEKYPEIRFISSSIEKECDDYIAKGELNMMGISKDVAIHFKYNGTSTNKKNNKISIFEGHFKLNRVDHGMSKTTSVNNEVDVKFYTELIKSDK